MTISEEIRIEFSRIKRNVEDLKAGWQEHIGRDLVAGLRNWVQLADEIDGLAKENGWKLRFPVHQKTKAEKAILKDGSEAFYTPGKVERNGMTVASVRFGSGIDKEEMRKVALSGQGSVNAKQETTFKAWLNSEVYETKTTDGKRFGISRKLFIERTSNVLGGTHPASTYIPERNEQVFDQQIIELLDTRILDMPVPWTMVVEAANGIIDTFDEHLA